MSAIVLACGSLLAAVPLAQSQQSPTAATAVIVARVIDTRNAAVVHARVELSSDALPSRTDGGSASRIAMTNEDGDVVFTGLPAGFYNFGVYKNGFMQGRLEPDASGRPRQEPLQLVAGERRVDLVFRMRQLATVSGSVTDDAGAPLVYASVGAYRRRIVSGRPRFELELSGSADDRGVYHIGGLEPGPYVFVATASSLRLALPASGPGGGVRRFVYGSVARPPVKNDGSLEPIVLSAGDRLEDVDFQMAPEPAVRVRGVLTGGDSRATLTLRAEDQNGSLFAFLKNASASLQSDGTFTFDGVRSGRYVLTATQRPADLPPMSPMNAPTTVIQTASGASPAWFNLTGQPQPPPPAEPLLIAEQLLVVGNSDVDGVAMTFHQGPMLRGRVVFDGVASPPTGKRLRNFTIDLRPLDDRTFPFESSRATIADDGRVSAGSLAGGRYIIEAPAIDEWTLRSAMAAGKDLALEAFDVTTTDLRDVVFTFTDRHSLVQGRVTRDAGRHSTPVYVLMFPANPRLWVDYGNWSSRMFIAQADDNGEYGIEPHPGDYCILAISSGIPDDWQASPTLERLSALATRVTLSEGEQATINLRAINLGRQP